MGKIKFKTHYMLKLQDTVMCAVVIFTLAFHDKSTLFALVQVIGSLYIYVRNYPVLLRMKKTVGVYLLFQICFIIWGAMSATWSVKSSVAVSSVISTIQVTVVGLAIILYSMKEGGTHRLIHFMQLGAMILILRMILVVPRGAWGTDRVGNYIGYGNNGAPTILSYVAVFSFYMFVKTKKKYWIITILCLVFAFFCGSRKSIIIAIIGIGLQLIMNSKNLSHTILRLIEVILLALALIFLVMNVPSLYNILGYRLQRMMLAISGQSGGDSSAVDRLLFIHRAFEVFKGNPLRGVGLDNFRFYNFGGYYAHNNYAEIAADLGIVGLILFYGYRYAYTAKVWSIMDRKNSTDIMIFVVMITILFLDLGNVSYSMDSLQMIYAVVYGAMCHYLINTGKRKNRGVIGSDLSSIHPIDLSDETSLIRAGDH